VVLKHCIQVVDMRLRLAGRWKFVGHAVSTEKPIEKKQKQKQKKAKTRNKPTNKQTHKQTSKLVRALSNVCSGSLQTKAFNSQDFSLTTDSVVRTYGYRVHCKLHF